MGKLEYTFNQPKERIMNACVASANALGWSIIGMEAEYGKIEIITSYKLKYNGKHSLMCQFYSLGDMSTNMIINTEFLDGVWDPTSSGKKLSKILFEYISQLIK